MHVGRSLLEWKYFVSSKSVCLSFSLKCQDMRKNNELHEEKHQTCVFVCCIMENTTAHCSTAHVSEMTWNEVDCSSQHDAHQHLPAVNTHFNKYWISADSLSGPIRGWWRVVWCCSRIRTSRSRKSKIPWLTLLKSERLYKKFADWWGAQGICRLHRGPFNHLLVKISCLDIKIAFFFLQFIRLQSVSVSLSNLPWQACSPPLNPALSQKSEAFVQHLRLKGESDWSYLWAEYLKWQETFRVCKEGEEGGWCNTDMI